MFSMLPGFIFDTTAPPARKKPAQPGIMQHAAKGFAPAIGSVPVPRAMQPLDRPAREAVMFLSPLKATGRINERYP
ncbi:MAG: hypothetical protein ACR2RL_25820 [Gammaproteobacteria bacterium]